MAGQRTSLDGDWGFRTDAQDAGLRDQWYRPPTSSDSWSTIRIPGPWEQHGADGDHGIGWYRRDFDLARANHASESRICLAGIDQSARVWINGHEATSDSPIPERFAVHVGHIARPGRNTVVVRVHDHGVPGGILHGAWLQERGEIDAVLPGEHRGVAARPSADWVHDAVIYEVYLRSFSSEGDFHGLEQRLDDLRQLGVTIIWLMPIHPVGKSRRKGTLGSPYSIRDYYGINPEFGTLDDLKSLLDATHARGMRLIVDLVINHTAWDSVLIREHPEWFRRDPGGEIRAPLDDWHDVAQLDYGVPELRRYLSEMMLYWVRDVGLDGFRCDVAGMLPHDFWSSVRDELDAVKPVLMLAEDDQPVQHTRAFDVTYDWSTYQALGRLRAGKLRPESIATILTNERLDYPAGSLRLRFSSNHDLCAWHRPGLKRYGYEAAKAAAVMTFALPGVPLIYNGQEAGNERKLSLFRRVPIDWRRGYDCELRGIYANLARLRRERRSLARGEIEVLSTPADQDILGIRRTWQEETTYVLVNCSLARRRLGAATLLPGRPHTLLGATMPGRGSSSREIDLPALGYWIGTSC